MMASGYVKLHRKMAEWGWYTDTPTKVVFLHLLLTANYKETEWKGITIKPGQAVIGRKKLAQDLGLSERQVRTALEHLKSTNEVTIEPTNKFSIVTIENWTKYQLSDSDCDQQSDQQSDQQPTSNRPATDQQPTTPKEVKKEKKEKKDKKYIMPPLGEFENVKLTEEELVKLQERYPYDWQERIERLSRYMSSRGKRYKNHYATILNWARNDEERAGRRDDFMNL